MMGWWSGRTRREQVLLAVMAVTLGACVLWFGVHRPAEAARAAAEERYDRVAQERVVAVRAVARIRALARAERGPARRLPPAEAMAASAAAAGVTLSRVEPEREGGVQVAVGGVSPAKLFPWIAALQQDYGVVPRHMTVIKDEQGSLSMDASFGGGG